MKIRSVWYLAMALPLMLLAENTTPVPSGYTWGHGDYHPGVWQPPANNPQQTPPQPSPEDIQRNAAADKSDKDGLQALGKESWDVAIQEFQTALKYRPGDKTILQHLQAARDHQRLAVDAATQAAFDAEKEGALQNLKDVASDKPASGLKALDDSSAMNQLKGGNFDSLAKSPSSVPGLKSLEPDASKPASAPAFINFDAMVVDARNVPTGLPKSVEDTIPPTPAGDRVRKAFEAVSSVDWRQHDWRVALAWFQDALNHDPGNAGIERLVEGFEINDRLFAGSFFEEPQPKAFRVCVVFREPFTERGR